MNTVFPFRNQFCAMSSSQASWWPLTVAALTFITLVGCDVPTGDPSPSINTDTEISTPLVQEKTFTFLGGPNSEFDPLVDTTSSDFDSLFTVGQEGDIGIVQNIDDFDIGALDEALDEAGGDLAISDQFSESLIANSDLVNQDIDASYARKNSVYESSDPDPLPSAPISDDNDDDEINVDFPAPGTSTDDVLEAPDFGAVDASSATVTSVTTTNESLSNINEIQFTLTNNGSNTLDDGNGGPPEIQVDGRNGNSSQQAFGSTILPGESETAVVDISGLALGDGASYRLFVAGTDASNTADLEVDLSAWRYQTATLSDAQNVDISASSPSSVSTAGSDASSFEGLNVDSGILTLDVSRSNDERDAGSFDPSINSLDVTNGSTASFANVNSFDTGNRSGNEIDMAGNGIAKTVNVNALTLSPTSSEITIGAADVYTIDINGELSIETMFFRPDGETIQASGEVQISNDQLAFSSGDFVEIRNALIEATNVTVDPEVDFDTLAFSYPDLRRRDADGDGNLFEADDSLEVRFVENPDGPFEFDRASIESGFEVPLEENLRIQPSSANSVEFTVFGRLESDPSAEAIVDVDDGISATTSVGDFEIQEISVSQADRFTVEVTSDENNDGQVDLANDAEAETASFDGFEGISDQVDGLELADVNLDFSVATKNLASTKIQLYAAILGRNENDAGSNIFLAGTPGTDRAVSSSDLSSFETGFANTAGSDPNENLIGFEVDRENDNLGERVNPPPLSIDDGNSNVNDFVNALPTEIRFVGLAEMNAAGGDLQLRQPLKLDAGFTLEIPLRIRDRFVVRDTIDADLSDLNDLTDPEKDVNISTAELQFSYTNGLPLGADVKMVVVDAAGSVIETFNDGFDNENLRIQPAAKNGDGAAASSSSGTFVFTLGSTQEALRALADGDKIRLAFNMDQAGSGGGSEAAARLRADDQLTLNRVRLEADASIQTGN